MPAYVINLIDVTDPARHEAYKRLAVLASAKNGGRFLVRGADQSGGGPDELRIHTGYS